ncbi:MarR family winged helix-turn-helix transcriptional regulator [Geobacillus sp. Y412MC52]|uniref:MarR family winged helix-turn-helix transcriptional regulator n=1 Tax=Geobacillus sp. (strain Y412MC52) TaxID=550542 RepID=UPI00018C17E5|nr:MarR family transcriptional regulator [Geobacillus sp. Y412MC52]ADU93792.1 transcriptional regulator, MarR family [Geobacillus sp. Y412MC52]
MSSEFSNLTPTQRKLLVALRENSTNTVLFHASIAKQCGLNETDHKCLDYIIRNGPVTAGQIMAYTGLTSGAVTGIINRLEEKGYVRRSKDAEDKRKVLVEAIPESMARIDALFEPVMEDTIRLLRCYSEEELAVILDFVSRCNRMIQTHMATE